MSIRTARLDYVPGLRPVISPFSEREAGWVNTAKPANGLTQITRMTTANRHGVVVETNRQQPAKPIGSMSRHNGGAFGRKLPIADTEGARLVRILHEEQRQSVRWIATQCGISQTTVYEYLNGREPRPERLAILRRLAK